MPTTLLLLPPSIFGQYYAASALFSFVLDLMENGSMYQIGPLLFVKVQEHTVCHTENVATCFDLSEA